MRTVELRIAVAAAAGISGNVELAASLHLPDGEAGGEQTELFVALHGGGYRRFYWNAAFPGFAGYSYAEHVTAHGHAMLAIDLLGMGDSSRPEPESLLSRAAVAAANHEAVLQAVRGLQDGTWGNFRRIITTGIGHSIGGMMVITQQAAHRSFDRLAVLGWSNQPLVLGDVDPADLARAIEPGYLATPREPMRTFFYAPDVPQALIEADEAMASTTPSCLGRDALTPGIVHEAAAAIAVPVFLMHGSVDTSPAPHREPAYFTGSHDVTLMVLPDTAHCHNFAARRGELWDRMERWVAGVPV